MKKMDWIGYSEISLKEAIDNALAEAGEHSWMMVVETQSSQMLPDKRSYQAHIVTYTEAV